MRIASDTRLPFIDDYEPPLPFTATLRNIVIQSDHPEALSTPFEVSVSAIAGH